jgi:hypothetical protein
MVEADCVRMNGTALVAVVEGKEGGGSLARGGCCG